MITVGEAAAAPVLELSGACSMTWGSGAGASIHVRKTSCEYWFVMLGLVRKLLAPTLSPVATVTPTKQRPSACDHTRTCVQCVRRETGCAQRSPFLMDALRLACIFRPWSCPISRYTAQTVTDLLDNHTHASCEKSIAIGDSDRDPPPPPHSHAQPGPNAPPWARRAGPAPRTGSTWKV